LLTHPTLDLLHQLGLNGMAKAFGEIEASDEATTLSHPGGWLCSSTGKPDARYAKLRAK
jgi:hypothetical protein